MPDRRARIETADAEMAATYELMQAMKRFYTCNKEAKRRAVLHMAMAHMNDSVVHQADGIWLKLR